MNIKRLLQNIGYNLCMTSVSRGNYLRKNRYFKQIGENVRLPMMVLPLYPKLVSIHNNVEVASGVKFVVHDAIHGVVNQDGHSGVQIPETMGTIEIFDNVFIGAGSIICPVLRLALMPLSARVV